MNPLDSLGISGWSVLLHLVNIFSLVVVMTVVLYKPLLQFMTARRTRIEGSIEEIEQLKKDFDEKVANMKEEREMLVQSFQEQMVRGKKDLEDQRTALVTDMNAAREKMMMDTQRDLGLQRERFLSEVQQGVLGAMQRIVVSVVRDTVDEGTVRASIAERWKQEIERHDA